MGKAGAAGSTKIINPDITDKESLPGNAGKAG